MEWGLHIIDSSPIAVPIFDLPRSCDQSPIPHRNGLSTDFSTVKKDIKEYFEGSKRDRDKKGLVLARAELT